MAYKLDSKLSRTEAARQNLQNGISYLQVQDGALTTVAKIVDRMAELRTMANDVTKNTQDVENYSKEFIELQRQLNQIRHEKFNGISLFSTSQTLSTNNPPDLRPQLDKGRQPMIWVDLPSLFQANSHNCRRSGKRWKCLLECGEFTAHVIFGRD